ncbi:MAG TPA: HigA family addiction module antitoxin [Cyclobacteriaceae bacterium]|jgi:addiction module HigA family antidote|nr:HigA family addiction module antitoxin [Cyclobacteriaceae bacterium]
MDKKQPVQNNPPHPGEILQEFYFKPLRFSLSDASIKTSISATTLLGIIRGVIPISLDSASSLAKYFNTSIQFWMSLQHNYDHWKKYELNKK